MGLFTMATVLPALSFGLGNTNHLYFTQFSPYYLLDSAM